MSGNIGRAGLQRQAGEPLLRIGSRSPAVTELQQALAAAGFPLAADGIFGPGTRSAVVAFQRSVGLAADGVVGPKTWQGLKSGGGGPTAAGRSSGRLCLNAPAIRDGRSMRRSLTCGGGTAEPRSQAARWNCACGSTTN